MAVKGPDGKGYIEGSEGPIEFGTLESFQIRADENRKETKRLQQQAVEKGDLSLMRDAKTVEEIAEIFTRCYRISLSQKRNR